MAEYVLVNKKQLEADLTVVAESIRAKGGTTEKLEFPQGMKIAVEAIQDGIDTSSSNPVTSDEMANGKEAFVNGEKVVGSARTTNSGSTATANASMMSEDGNGKLEIGYTFSTPSLYKENSKLNIRAPLALFGSAKKSDVVKGVTFTSVDGYSQEGEFEGIDTSSDVPALSEDIANGKEAFVNGEKVTGSVTVISEDVEMGDKLIWNADKGIVTDILLMGDFLMRKGIHINQYLSKSKLGNATSNDVAQGVSFTSENGIKIDGGLNVVTDSKTYKYPSIADHKTNKEISVPITIDADTIFRKNVSLEAYLKYSSFGNAQLENVLEGSTFTSSVGYQVQGNIPKVAPTEPITPSTEDQIAFPKGSYASGDIIVLGDPNLKAENIKSGVTIFGIEGTCSSGNSGSIVKAKSKELTLGTFKTSGSPKSLSVNIYNNPRTSNGSIIATSTGSVVFDSATDNHFNHFWNTYVQVNGEFYFVPSGATGEITTSSYTCTVKIHQAQQLVILA